MPLFPNGLSRAILPAGLTAGFLDAVAASVQFYLKTNKNPTAVWRYVASGVFGKKAFAGGLPMAGWGLLFHFMIAFLFTLFFLWLYPRISLMRKNSIATGLIYGMLVWVVMNRIVVPLSNVPPATFHWGRAAIAMLILMFCIGLPISLIAKKYYLYKK